MSTVQWYQSFYGEDHLRIYGPALSPSRTAQEVDGIVSLLGLSPGEAILDLCCGHGRHAIALAQRGYQLVGQDLSEVFLRRAAVDAQAQAVEVRWICKDLRDIPFG